ncbi:MAG: SRPBCC family protein [Flavobacterium sp.]|jgi:carbon monoxide dehydrogenase subunit G|nr:SRPBCC family protein [Flavobacterium sp.]MBT6880810.1 SRPBCC family protein [Flavobacterium sp.]
MNIEGKKVVVAKSSKEAYEFFMTLENFELLMPSSTQKFEVDGDSFLFALKGMPEIRLVLGNSVEYSKVSLGAASSKLAFTLEANILPISDNSSDVQLQFEGDFNPMMAMMVKKPLTSFIDTLTENIAKL